jgi:hypothetical protein
MVKRLSLGDVGQWAGLIASVGSTIYEAVVKADIGYIFISGAAVLYAVATKIKYYNKRIRHYDVKRIGKKD